MIESLWFLGDKMGVEGCALAFEERNVEAYLAVGIVAVFDLEPHRKDGPRCKTIFRGWRRPNHVMVDRPKAASGSGYAALQEGQSCVVRYLYEGQACAFDSMILDWDARHYNPYLRIAWPKQIEHVAFRKHERIKLQLTCGMEWPDGEKTTGSLRDLSMGGCGAVCGRAPQPGDSLALSFALPDGTSIAGLSAVVRGVREVGAESWLIGCEYGPGQEALKNNLAFFVTSTLERRRTDNVNPARPERLLIVDDNADLSQRLKRNFETRGFEVVLADNAVDAMYRLRMTPPSAVVLSQTLSDLTGLDVCRVLKRHEDFAQLPVYVYGGEPDDMEGQVRNAGGTGYFPPSLTLAPDMARTLLQTLKPSA